ncbi:MAG: type IV pilus assembly protein PilM [Nitrospinota bacterium]|nr:MAG: type IV pilus assembly protein PilM [Nitrospinota bacterium]
MFFKRPKQLVAIDIGSYAVKLTQLKESGRGYQLTHFGMIPLAPEAIVDGTIMDAGSVAEAIRRLGEMEQVKTKEVVTALSGHAVIIKKIQLPRMSEEELAESIQWEAQQYIPFDVEEVNIDFQILGNGDREGESQMDVLLVAVKKEKIDDYTGLLVEAGFTPVVVDVDVFALENSFELNYPEELDKVVALINIGASLININILVHGVTSFQRDSSPGGNRYTERIQRELHIGYEQAEALKFGVEVGGFSPKEILPILRSVTEDIAAEIQRSFEFFRATSGDISIDKIYLSGGCARIRGIDRYLSSKLDIPTEIVNPFKNLRVDEKVFDPLYLHSIAPLAAVGVGLALRRVDDR